MIWLVSSLSSFLLAIPVVIYNTSSPPPPPQMTTADMLFAYSGPLLVMSSILCNGDPNNKRWLKFDFQCITLHSIIYICRQHKEASIHTFILCLFGGGYILEETILDSIAITKDAALLGAMTTVLSSTVKSHGIYAAASVAVVGAAGVAAVFRSRQQDIVLSSATYICLRWIWHFSVTTFLMMAL